MGIECQWLEYYVKEKIRRAQQWNCTNHTVVEEETLSHSSCAAPLIITVFFDHAIITDNYIDSKTKPNTKWAPLIYNETLQNCLTDSSAARSAQSRSLPLIIIAFESKEWCQCNFNVYYFACNLTCDICNHVQWYYWRFSTVDVNQTLKQNSVFFSHAFAAQSHGDLYWKFLRIWFRSNV